MKNTIATRPSFLTGGSIPRMVDGRWQMVKGCSFSDGVAGHAFPLLVLPLLSLFVDRHENEEHRESGTGACCRAASRSAGAWRCCVLTVR